MENRPIGIDERPEQIRPPVIKAEGNTNSERYLAKLAERSFLNLWSYPSPYRDQKKNSTGHGKELCDLLVVCDRHIVIFSEKTIGWPAGDLKTAWCRWAKRAISDSAKQTRGAERWLSEYPERLYLDRSCTAPFPIDLPSKENREFHRVVVANGSAEAIRRHIPDSSGSLIIKPTVSGADHWYESSCSIEPFVVGDIDPDGSFVHVFNETSLDIVMSELDTITDFTDYLTKKAAFIRSGKLAEAQGEENLLAFYAIRINDEGDHDFVLEDTPLPITIDSFSYQRFINDPHYVAKKQEDRISYIWDSFIEVFTNRMLDGTSITLEGHDFILRKNEIGVRYMALASRFLRRCYAQAIAGALEKGKTTERFFRVMMGREDTKNSEIAFFIQTLKYPEWMEFQGGYERYRLKRTESAQVYSLGLLERYSYLKRVVGISREPPDQGRGISEDLIYVEQADWSDDERNAIRQDCDTYGVLQSVYERPWQGHEFPEVEPVVFERPSSASAGAPLNRKQRRAMKARNRRR